MNYKLDVCVLVVVLVSMTTASTTVSMTPTTTPSNTNAQETPENTPATSAPQGGDSQATPETATSHGDSHSTQAPPPTSAPPATSAPPPTSAPQGENSQVTDKAATSQVGDSQTPQGTTSPHGGESHVTETSPGTTTPHGGESHGTSPGHHGNETGDGSHSAEVHHESHGIHVVKVDIENVKYPLIFTLVVILAGLSKIGFHHAGHLSSTVPESCVLILLGVILGAILFFSGMLDTIEFFSPHEFFIFMLPPIILEASYSLHERTFFENIGSILLLAVFGTIISFFLIGFTLLGLYKAGAMEEINCTPIQILVFSALIVAVDPVAVLAVFQEVGVNKVLYFMVFGESLLNDGVTVVLYNVMQTYNKMDVIPGEQYALGIMKFLVVCVCSVLIGVVVGLISSFITRFTASVKVVEPIVVFGFAYLSYILAEMFHLSGILGIIACGLAQAQYAFCNLTNKSLVSVKFFAKVMSNSSEIIIFLFLGLKIVHPDHHWVTGFTLWATFLCLFYRFIVVFVMVTLINRYDASRTRKITLDEMFMISYGGLRGAVCFSLVALLDEKEYPMKNMFLTTTFFIIIFTVFIQGGTIKFLVKKLRVKLADTDQEMHLSLEFNQKVMDHVMAGIEQVIGCEGKYYIREKFEHLDDKFFRPLLLKDCSRNTEMEELSTYYQKLIMKEHYKTLQNGGAILPRVRTEIRSLDSEMCLQKLAEDGDHEVIEKREKATAKTAEKNKKRDVKQVFLEAMHTISHHGHFKTHDKNMAFSQRQSMVANLRKRHKQNRVLREMRTKQDEAEMGEHAELPVITPNANGGGVKVPGTVKKPSQGFENNAFQMNEVPVPRSAMKGSRTNSIVKFTVDSSSSEDEEEKTIQPKRDDSVNPSNVLLEETASSVQLVQDSEGPHHSYL